MINRVKIPIKDDEGNVLYEINLRDYAISIWTLLDVFINVLKGFNSDIPGMIMDPHMTLSDDGTLDLNFTIPMYIKYNRLLIENPIWYNTRNGNLIANMRKIKVIFRKTQDEEKIYEFLITLIEESHSDDLLTCSLTCEGLAFHELGKIGYKHELSSDQFLAEYNEWADGEKTTPEPVNNLLYWVEHLLGIPPLPTGEGAVIDPQVWYYKVDMNWDAYVDSVKREPDVVYEEGYVSSWTDDAASKPKSTVSAHEKLVMLDESESNDYNLTQAIAEKFRVHCRYEYGHDAHYHITSRTIIFYNNFIKEAEGYLGFIYPYSTNDISRSMDSTDIITKMYVRSIEDDSTGSGLITIMDSEANKSREDYIFNFDYLYEIGVVDSDILEDVKKHESKLREINNQLIPMQEQLITINDNLNKAKADLAFAENSIALDIERLTQNNSQMNALDAVDGISDNKISIDESAPKMAVVIYDKHGRCAINITEKGVLYDTIKVYKSYTMLPAANESRLQSEISILRGEFDEFNNLTKVYVATKPERPVYMIYDYLPRLYWEHIALVWATRLAKDTAKKEAMKAEILKLTAQKNFLEDFIKSILQTKQNIINEFNRHLGPAIREGNWTPEDYKNCEDRYNDKFSIANNYPRRKDNEIIGYEVSGSTVFSNFLWDILTFSGEDSAYYQLGVLLDTIMYPWIDISGLNLGTIDNTLTLVYHDFESSSIKPYTLLNAHFLVVGSSCLFGFILLNGIIKSAIILTSCPTMGTDEFNLLRQNGYLTHITSNSNEILEDSSTHIQIQNFLHGNNQPLTSSIKPWQSIYPRIEFKTLAINLEAINFYIGYNGKKLEEYTDYSILSRDGYLYATIKPEALLRNGGILGTLNLLFSVSRASTAIYLDAKEVLRENSRPLVSYTIKPSVFNLEFMHTAYEALDRIVDINDTLLKFENVLGYITKLDLDLDNPWEDSIEVKNYKTKFEDLFTSIVASTEEMKRNSELYTTTANLFNRDGTLKSNVLLNSIMKADLNYSFNNGALTIDPVDGIWGVSESGVVAMRGGGIFTATEKDANGNWIWNTGILPLGINANLLTAGLLDTNKILIYAGDNVRFLMNSEGLYAYKYMTNEERTLAALSILKEENNELLEQFNTDMLNSNYIDSKQYVVHNPEGLFLRAEVGAWIYAMHKVDNQNKKELFLLTQPVDRVSISWDGLKLRNWNGTEVLYADADYGNLTLKGTVRATAFTAEGNNSNFFADGLYMGFYQTVTITGDTYTASNPILTISGTAINATGDLSIKSGKQLKIEGENNNYVTINKDGVTINGEWLKVDTSNFKLDSVLQIFKLFVADLNKPSVDISTAGITIQSGGNLDVNTKNFTLDSYNSKIEFKDDSNNSIVKINKTGANINTTNLVLKSTSDVGSPSLLLKNNGTDVFNFSNGSLTITGKITATELYVGKGDSQSMTYEPSEGLKITKGSITIGTTTINGNSVPAFKVDENGNLTAHNGTFDGNISGSTITSGTITGATITGGSINVPDATSPKFKVDITGKVTATDLKITGGEINVNNSFIVTTGGVMTAKGATIDGTVYATALHVGAKTPDNSSGADFMSYNSTGLTIGSGANKLTYDGTTLKVTGNIEANNGTFNGSITAGSTITGATINGGAINVPATNSKFTVDEDGNVEASSLKVTGGSITIGDKFSVDEAGVLNATSATFSGTITASNIYMGGNNTVSNNLFSVSDGGDVNAKSITIGDTGEKSNGYLTYTSGSGLEIKGGVTATTGKIGDWIIGGDFFYNPHKGESGTAGIGIGDGSSNLANWTFLADCATLSYGAGNFTVNSQGNVTAKGGIVTSAMQVYGDINYGSYTNGTFTSLAKFITNNESSNVVFLNALTVGGVRTEGDTAALVVKGQIAANSISVAEGQIAANSIAVAEALTINGELAAVITDITPSTGGYISSMNINGTTVNFTNANNLSIIGVKNTSNEYGIVNLHHNVLGNLKSTNIDLSITDNSETNSSNHTFTALVVMRETSTVIAQYTFDDNYRDGYNAAPTPVYIVDPNSVEVTTSDNDKYKFTFTLDGGNSSEFYVYKSTINALN